MKVYPTEAIRNLSVIGHGDAGKTQLVSSLLYVAGATPRWGKVDEGTTVTDYEEDSIARKITLNTALAHLEHRDTKLNFIDTPGYAAFVAHARPALASLIAPSSWSTESKALKCRQKRRGPTPMSSWSRA